MTEFIGSDHPDGDAIPMDYAGKGVSEYWNEVQGRGVVLSRSQLTAAGKPAATHRE